MHFRGTGCSWSFERPDISRFNEGGLCYSLKYFISHKRLRAATGDATVFNGYINGEVHALQNNASSCTLVTIPDSIYSPLFTPVTFLQNPLASFSKFSNNFLGIIQFVTNFKKRRQKN